MPITAPARRCPGARLSLEAVALPPVACQSWLGSASSIVHRGPAWMEQATGNLSRLAARNLATHEPQVNHDEVATASVVAFPKRVAAEAEPAGIAANSRSAAMASRSGIGGITTVHSLAGTTTVHRIDENPCDPTIPGKGGEAGKASEAVNAGIGGTAAIGSGAWIRGNEATDAEDQEQQRDELRRLRHGTAAARRFHSAARQHRCSSAASAVDLHALVGFSGAG